MRNERTVSLISDEKRGAGLRRGGFTDALPPLVIPVDDEGLLALRVVNCPADVNIVVADVNSPPAHLGYVVLAAWKLAVQPAADCDAFVRVVTGGKVALYWSRHPGCRESPVPGDLWERVVPGTGVRLAGNTFICAVLEL